MDMDMDIGWCLTCAKRTVSTPTDDITLHQRDQASPYCSDSCRQADTNPSTPVTEAMVITSPLPPKLVPLPPTPLLAPPDRRPSLVVCEPNGMASPTSHPRQRDRRAFSFPASEEEETRPSLPSFNRKPKGVNATSFKKGYASRLSTGGTTTPNGDSAVYSTSESDRDEVKSPRRPPLSPLASVSILHPQPPLPMSRITHVPVNSQGTSLSSQLQTPRQSIETRTVGSPVTRMASSSSRSREDIISWARGVDDAAPEGSTSRHSRGRGRRPEALANLTPPSTEPLDEPQGRTPRSASALSALNMTFGPVVNALRNVSLVSTPPEASVLGLQACAAPAVSRIDVSATRIDDIMFNEGCTPTLSTVSMSEAVDTSNATDVGETIETATDGFSVTSSHYRTPPPATLRPAETSSRRSSGLPRPPSLQQTASALWNFSSYLRSLAPFAAPFSLASSPSPAAKADLTLPLESAASTMVLTPALGLDIGPMATAAVPAVPRSEVTEELNDPAAQLVRSVPLDIVIAAGSKAQAITEERAREREVIEFLGPRSTSRSRAAAQKPSLVHQPPYEVSSRSDEDDDRGRGRRRGRRNEERSTEREVLETASSDERRGRRRDRIGESRDRSWSAARGRVSRSRAGCATVRA